MVAPTLYIRRPRPTSSETDVSQRERHKSSASPLHPLETQRILLRGSVFMLPGEAYGFGRG
jgi:hypothetical protein